MQKTLGIDLGSNSLGWAILDDVAGDIQIKVLLCSQKGLIFPQERLWRHPQRFDVPPAWDVA